MAKMVAVVAKEDLKAVRLVDRGAVARPAQVMVRELKSWCAVAKVTMAMEEHPAVVKVTEVMLVVVQVQWVAAQVDEEEEATVVKEVHQDEVREAEWAADLMEVTAGQEVLDKKMCHDSIRCNLRSLDGLRTTIVDLSTKLRR